MTIKSCDAMELVELFVKLCPRIEQLTTNTCRRRFEVLLQFLLSITSGNTRHLVSLCVEYVSETDIDVARKFIESQKNFHIDLMEVEQFLNNDTQIRHTI
jgi:hypothetical protein